jgi:hypothetical protein
MDLYNVSGDGLTYGTISELLPTFRVKCACAFP